MGRAPSKSTGRSTHPSHGRTHRVRRAGTVHVGGSLADIASAEIAPWSNRVSERPFVLLAQPTLFDPSRAPAGQHTAWGYCHVPNGWRGGATEAQVIVDAMEAQIERFGPGFRERILARAVNTPQMLESWNANLGGRRRQRRGPHCGTTARSSPLDAATVDAPCRRRIRVLRVSSAGRWRARDGRVPCSAGGPEGAVQRPVAACSLSTRPEIVDHGRPPGTPHTGTVYISLYHLTSAPNATRLMSGPSTRTAKLFWNGRSQAVRLPKEFRFDGDEVEISRDGDQVVLTPVVRERFEGGYWDRIDALAGADDLSDIDAIGANLLDPDVLMPDE